jgi:ribosomal protein L31E
LKLFTQQKKKKRKFRAEFERKFLFENFRTKFFKLKNEKNMNFRISSRSFATKTFKVKVSVTKKASSEETFSQEEAEKFL